MKNECCKNCCFMCTSDNVVNVQGMTCVRYPPTVAPLPRQSQLTGEVQMTIISLPVNVSSDYWCGEFKIKEETLKCVS